MRLHAIKVENFRLLSDIDLALEECTTLIVGRNNSGKTSLYEVIRRFLKERGKAFKIEDFSTACYDRFCIAAGLQASGEDDAKIRAILPAITLRLTFKYDPQQPDFGSLAPFIVDLDPDADEAVAMLTYELNDGQIENFFEDAPVDFTDDDARNQFFRLLRERVPAYYRTRIWAEDPNDASNTRTLSSNDLSALLDTGFINAQRGLDDNTHRENGVLGGVLESLFLAAKAPNADAEDQKIADALDEAIQEVQEQVDEKIKRQLDELLPALETVGFPGLNDAQLQTETTLDVLRLLSNFTHVRYAGHNGIALPESYNGLGVRNLILILMRIVGYYKEFRAKAVSPGVQVIFIEEPEAHLHPQMQEVFIRELERLASQLQEGDGRTWPVQFVVSTHSSHVANQAGFKSIRYFLSSPIEEQGGIRHSKVKDLRSGLSATCAETKALLHKYLTLTRCDLFFADKAILVEGMSERLMIPAVIQALETPEGTAPLASQYVTLMEVGGAYAHLFFDLLEFLELSTLVITDIDAVSKNDDSGKWEARLVHEGTHTSNATLKDWFDEKPCPIQGLLTKTVADKTRDRLRVAYQIPDHASGACGRTFEDAFILVNADKFEVAENTREELEQAAQDEAKKLKKSQFALRYAIDDMKWIAPTYITEGLQWLASGASTNGAAATEANDDA